MSVFAWEFIDMPNNWSRVALEKAIANGLLKGDSGKIRPKDSLTRAEMATILNRSFQSRETSSLKAFTDVSPGDWYYEEMGKAVEMKIFKGTGDKLNPNKNITRQEAFLALGRAFKISEFKKGVLDKFSDKGSISTWAKDGVSALVSAGYIAGSNGKINPKQNITRAEFAQIMDNLLKTYITKEGQYTEDYKGNVMINKAGVILKGNTLDGDLIIGDGVGDGEVTLDGVTVKGRIVVRGGGENSIKIIGNSNVKNIIIARVDGKVRVYSEDGVEIGEVTIDGNDDVILEGEFDLVTIVSEKIKVVAKNANIQSLTSQGSNTTIEVDENSTIGNVEANGEDTTIEGEGEVKKVSANGDDIAVNTKGTEVKAGKDTKGVTVGDKKVEAGETERSESKAETKPTPRTTPEPSGGGGASTPPTPPTKPTVIPVSGISVNPETLALVEEDSTSILASVSPSNATNKNVTWESDNTSIATVDSSGKITGISAGTTTITATTVDGGKTASTQVTVKTPSPDNYFTFKSDAGTIEINEDNNEVGVNIVIPVKINGVEVEVVGEEGFAGASLSSVVIPNTVTSIGDMAFVGNNLKEVRIPDSVTTIGAFAFAANELEEVTIPKSVRTIGPAAFNENKLADEQAFIYGRNDNGNEDKTKVVSYGGVERSDVRIPNSVTSIGAFAFAGNNLTSITIPNSVRTIGENTFRDNELTEVTIPDSVTRIEIYAFNNNNLTEVTIPDSVTTIGDYSFSENKLASINMQDSVDVIGEGAFSANELTEVTIPDSVTRIEIYAFNNNNLTSITIPDSVTTIGEFAFAHNRLTSITIAGSVTSIENGAFSHNGPEGNSQNIQTSNSVGTWELVGDADVWTKKGAVSGITVTSQGDANTVVNGQTLQMDVNITPTTATNKKVTWSVTSESGSATIDTNGLLTATSVGTVTVTATAQDGSGKEGTKEITVTAKTDISEAAATVVAPTASSTATMKSALTTDNTSIDNTSASVKVGETAVTGSWLLTSVDTSTGKATLTFTVSAEDTAYTGILTQDVVVTLAVKSSDASITGITVKGIVARVVSGETTKYFVQLTESNASELTATDIAVTLTDTKATVTSRTARNNGESWDIKITAEDGTTTQTYTLDVADPGQDKSLNLKFTDGSTTISSGTKQLEDFTDVNQGETRTFSIADITEDVITVDNAGLVTYKANGARTVRYEIKENDTGKLVEWGEVLIIAASDSNIISPTNSIDDASPKIINIALDKEVAGLVPSNFTVTKNETSYTEFTVTERNSTNYILNMTDAADYGDVFTVEIAKHDYVFIGTNVTNNVISQDLSTFTVELESAGDKYKGESFGLSITGARDGYENSLSGDVNVSVVSDQPGEGGPQGNLYNESVVFANGAATIEQIVLMNVANHTLTVTVAGVTNPKTCMVNVIASQASIAPTTATFANTDTSATLTITELVDATGADVLAGFTTDNGTLYEYTLNDNNTQAINVTVTKTTNSADLIIANPSQATAIGDYMLMITPKSGNSEGWNIPVTVTGESQGAQAGISGKVTSTVDQSPIKDVDVYIAGVKKVITNAQGEYSITDIEDGSYWISLYADFYYHGATPYQVSVPGTYNASMQKAGKITGTIELDGTLPEGTYIEAKILQVNNVDSSVTASDFTVRGVPINSSPVVLSFYLKNASEL